MEIDISDVITMGDFRGAIENAVSNYVKEYVSNALSGVHGIMEVAQAATSGLKEEETITVRLDLSEKQIGKHWGIVNITTDNNNSNSSDRVFPQVQIIIWWDENKNFNYSIAHNSLYHSYTDMTPHLMACQYIENDDVKFDDRTNVFSFVIKNIPRVYHNSNQTTYGGKFKVDYHIW